MIRKTRCRRAAICFAAAVVAVLTGCGARGLKPDEHFATPQGRDALGRVAYVVFESGGAGPEVQFGARGKGDGAAKGAGQGLLGCLQGSLSGGPLGLIVFVVLSPVCAVAGAVVGAVIASPAEAVRSAESALNQGMSQLSSSDALRVVLSAQIAAESVDLSPLPAAYVSGGITLTQAYHPDVRAATDTVLEAMTEQVGTRSAGDKEREFQFVLVVKFRLVAVGPIKDGRPAVLDEFTYSYASQPLAWPEQGDVWNPDQEVASAYCGAVAAAAIRWPRVLGDSSASATAAPMPSQSKWRPRTSASPGTISSASCSAVLRKPA